MTFLWHDYETFGTHPAYDRPAQFAAIRTDAQLQPVGEPLTWFAKPARDALPHPMACLVTCITPQRAEREGLVESEFAANIHAAMMEPETCGAGYNSVRFDDAVTRFLFYRNFFDPYEREYMNGNSRWDLIDLVRMCYALRPQGIEWPDREAEPGVPSFRLEDLTAANGIEHAGAHDALVDVRATIALARQLRRAQPRLFDWALNMRDQQQVKRLLAVHRPRPVLFTGPFIPATRGCTTLVLPLAGAPERPKDIIVFDLMADPAPLLELDAAAIGERVFTRSEALPEGVERLPLFTVGINKVPMLAPPATLRGVDTERIGLDVARCQRHAQQLEDHHGHLALKLQQVFERPPSVPDRDPDNMLYTGDFFSRRDRAGFRALRNTAPKDLGRFEWDFADRRIPEMLFRYRARNWPDTLDAGEQTRWEQDRLARLSASDSPDRLHAEAFRAALTEAREARHDDARALSILDDVEAWGESLLRTRELAKEPQTDNVT